MPLGRAVAVANRRITNRLLRPVAARMPGFGVIVHTGRNSGREYRTPVNVFPVPGGYVVALTYGAHSDWVRNVLAAEGCDLETRGRTEHLTAPHIFHDESRRHVPWMVRPALRLLGVADFMRLTRAPTVK
ncbi:MAG: nitroreductase family deazaflavin-dependent oxidoreductase [Actinomycetota bacterium]|nr:nitroreductase family deazaflavin-dependent oxidoreductase [Actinomycetota bacterium]